MGIAEQVRLMEKELEEMKNTNDIHAKLLKKNLYKYESYDEEGYLLAENEADARELIHGFGEYKIKEIVGHKSLMELIETGSVVTYFLPF